jgi:hypothetical protein
MLSDSSFDPTVGITCADINAEPVGAECVCKYGFKDFGVGCRRTQPLTLLRILVETDTKDWRLIDFENFAHVA